MNKLTAEKCRSVIDGFKWMAAEGPGMSIRDEYDIQAYEIALPILEQQERGNKATLTVEKRKWLIDECKADMQRYTSSSPRYLVAQIALASLEACCIIPEQATNQNGEQ